MLLKKLRVGERYWAEPNNFQYSDLAAITSLTNLESLDLSYTAGDGAESHRISFLGERRKILRKNSAVSLREV